MNILFTICGRAGSKGFKGKNLRELNGYPLVSYTLSAIDLLKNQIDANIDIALNTDSKELQDMISGYPELILVNRKKEHGTDSASKFTVIKDTLIESEKLTNQEYDMVIDLDITSPMRTVNNIKEMIDLKLANKKYDVIFSVVHARRNPYFNMVQEKDGFVDIIIPSDYTARQQTPTVYDMNASMYLYDPVFLKSHEAIFEGNCGYILMKDYLVLDIDSEEDYLWMSYLHEKFLTDDVEIEEVYKHIPNVLSLIND